MTSGRTLFTVLSELATVASNTVFLLLGLGVLLGLAHTFGDVLTLLSVGDESVLREASLWVIGTLAVSASFWTAIWLGRRTQPVPPLLFLCVLTVATLLLRTLLIETVDPAWSTDYLRYWERAVEMAARGDFSVSNIYQQRALLVPLPIELIFGPDARVALKWTNALLLLLVQLAAYDMMRLSINHQAAQASSIILLTSPLPAYAGLIPSHDLWAISFLAISVWAAVRALHLPARIFRRIACIAGLGVLAGLSAYALELQRSIGLILCLALFATALLYPLLQQTNEAAPVRYRPTPALLVATLALAVQPLVAAQVESAGLQWSMTDHRRTSTAMKYAAHGSAMSTGRSAWYARFNDRFRAKAQAGPESAEEFARSLIASTWILEPVGKLDAIREHAGRLFSMSYPMDWDTLLRRPAQMAPEVRNALIIHAGIFGTVLLSFSLASIIYVVTRRPSAAFPITACTILVVGVALVLLVLFENKPFNIAPVWLLYPLLIGSAVATVNRPRNGAHQPAARARVTTVRVVAPLTVLVFGFLGTWTFIRATHDISNGLVLDKWTLQLNQLRPSSDDWLQELQRLPPRAFETSFYVHNRKDFVLRDAPFDAERIYSRSKSMYLALRFPPGQITKGDTLVARRCVCLEPGSYQLEFFMFAPYSRPDVENSFTVLVEVDGIHKKSLPIPHEDRSDTMRLITIPEALISGPGCQELTISLKSNVNRSALSWSRASHVEIWFPRAVKSTIASLSDRS